MTEDTKHQELVQIMELLELVNDEIKATQMIEAVRFEFVTPKTWEHIQSIMPNIRGSLEILKAQLQESHKIIDNDALRAHATAVILAE